MGIQEVFLRQPYNSYKIIKDGKFYAFFFLNYCSRLRREPPGFKSRKYIFPSSNLSKDMKLFSLFPYKSENNKTL